MHHPVCCDVGYCVMIPSLFVENIHTHTFSCGPAGVRYLFHCIRILHRRPDLVRELIHHPPRGYLTTKCPVVNTHSLPCGTVMWECTEHFAVPSMFEPREAWPLPRLILALPNLRQKHDFVVLGSYISL